MHDVSTNSRPDQLAPESLCEDAIEFITVIGEQAPELEKRDEMAALQPYEFLPTSHHFSADARRLVLQDHITRLPDEVLIEVFEYLRGKFDLERDKYPTSGIDNIKTLRLTCRRFSDASSHLLLHHLDVAITTSALEHLERVSQHPTISKGVETLKIHAAFYNPAPARSLQEFTRQFVGTLHGDQHKDSHEICRHMDPFNFMYHTESSSWFKDQCLTLASNLINKLRSRTEILSSCDKYLESEVMQPDEDQNMAILCQIYRQYSHLISEQKALLEHGTFVKRVTEAVARMPTVTGLSITDEDFRLLDVMPEVPDPIYASFRERLLTTSSWAPRVLPQLSKRPVMLLYHLPLAIINGGIRLVRLHINLDPSKEHKLRLSNEEARGLVSAGEHLEALNISCQMTVQAFRKRRTSKQTSLCEFTCLFLKSKRLRSVSLHCHSEAGRLVRYSAEPLLGLLPWASLKEISLISLSIHYHELKPHIEKLVRGTCIFLDRVYLLSGTWVVLLDMLRGKADCNSVVSLPEGKEDDDPGEAFSELTADWDEYDNPASAYVSGRLSENPLRSLLVPDGTGQDNTDTDDTDGAE
ncbi:hypothetical protein F5883DRAFT_592959 [Diaporthe sp. PMI_573]|nr:hypothetical protein F5883DRAFT_592959 [Diaporthaceae sp. PMI_573]